MNNILIADGNNTQQKSESTQSIDVHLPIDKYCNIILPDGTIIVVNTESIYIYDATETLIKEVPLC